MAVPPGPPEGTLPGRGTPTAGPKMVQPLCPLVTEPRPPSPQPVVLAHLQLPSFATMVKAWPRFTHIVMHASRVMSGYWGACGPGHGSTRGVPTRAKQVSELATQWLAVCWTSSKESMAMASLLSLCAAAEAMS